MPLIDASIVALVSACTALLASVVGPLVTLTVAKRQFNATVLSANRQKWIDALRDTLAELISLLVAALVVRARLNEQWNKGRGAYDSDPAMLDKLQRLVLAHWKIRLLINPHEADHQRLHQAIDAALKRLRSEHTPDADSEADIELITTLAQSILKREWQRVKQGI